MNLKWLVVFLFLPASVVACPKNSTPYQDTCVYDIQPEIAKPVQPSEEKPPTDKMPSYQREGVNVIMAQSMTMDDEKLDKEKTDAIREGKKAAGIGEKK